MSDYERALKQAREMSVRAPGFEAIAAGSDRDRVAWTDEDRDARVRARRWLLLAAATWLMWPIIEALEMRWFAATGRIVFELPMACLLLWAARLSQDRRLRSALLTRAIAASNLILSVLYALTIGNTLATSGLAILLAVCSGRCLQLLGDRGLDGSEDPTSSFEPVKFRGVLILALILACADALTLLFAIAWAVIGLAHVVIQDDYVPWSLWLPPIGLTVGAVAVMAVNAWGLLRLRTWALFGGMVANVAIAALALAGTLLGGSYIAVALVTTAVIQLLLPIPILAAALGYGKERRYDRVGPMLLRVVVPALMLFTIVVATMEIVSQLRQLYPATW